MDDGQPPDITCEQMKHKLKELTSHVLTLRQATEEMNEVIDFQSTQIGPAIPDNNANAMTEVSVEQKSSEVDPAPEEKNKDSDEEFLDSMLL